MTEPTAAALPTPHDAFFRATDERSALLVHLLAALNSWKLPLPQNRALNVVEFGSRHGEVSSEVLSTLLAFKCSIGRYTYCNPVEAHLQRFLEDAPDVVPIDCLASTIDTYAPADIADIAIASYALSSVPDIAAAIRKLASVAKLVLIIHRSAKGLIMLRQTLGGYVRYDTPSAAATASEVIDTASRELQLLERFRSFRLWFSPSTISIGACKHSMNPAGYPLLSYILNRPIEEIPNVDRRKIAKALREAYPEDPVAGESTIIAIPPRV